MSDFPEKPKNAVRGDIVTVHAWLRAQTTNGHTYVCLDPGEWEQAAHYLGPWSFVPGTYEEPPLFWFEGRRFSVWHV